ncbi:YxeA family protein [Staphylococcus warneri]|uniref:YxeA family protein n=1 Tax=Staphylococcus warneri TaxID=1292 RepID=UPI000F53EB7D|nr:YxeA family protein [Staphylococcus warneri]RQM98049.1 hypothetical protein CPA43_06070 [Staphylococcus warneri]
MKYITTLLIVLIAFCMIVFTFVHHPIIDRFNPLLNMEGDYAKVPKNTQYYENITVFDKDGKKLDYKLTFNGFDSEREYAKVTHKGQYVKKMTYVNEANVPKEVKSQ